METIRGFKLVRADGTDCRSGTVKYAVGETTTLPDPDRRSSDPCGRGLHFCHRAEDTMQFRASQWPVRLLAVSSDDVIARDETKVRCGSVHVEREEPLALCFGPQGGRVVELLNDLASIGWLRPPSTVTAEQLQPLVDEHLSRLTRFRASVRPLPVRVVTTWDAAGDAARAAARDAARDAAWDAARAAAWDATHRVVADLVDWPSPWEPLLGVWRLGCWPIGVVRGEFVVFVPGATTDAR